MPLQNRPNIYPKGKDIWNSSSPTQPLEKKFRLRFLLRTLKTSPPLSHVGTCAAIASSERRAARSCLHCWTIRKKSSFRPPSYVDMFVKLDHFDPSKSGWKKSNKICELPPRRKKTAKKSHGKVTWDFFKLQTSQKTTIRTKFTSQNPSTVLRNPHQGCSGRRHGGNRATNAGLHGWRFDQMTHQLFNDGFFGNGESLVKRSSHTFFAEVFDLIPPPPKQKKMVPFDDPCN